jgi:Icc-related predicted phosphoesterase
MGSTAGTLRFVLISDTHGQHRELHLPPGDVLVHAGDLTAHGELSDLEALDAWLAEQPHPHKVVIAGNHDFCLERQGEQARARLRSAVYLEDQAATVAGVRFYGSPWQPWFYDWAFNLRRGEALREKWALIPPDTEVLVTHGPPAGVLDRTSRGELVGCDDLADAVARVRPALHVFGHIHEGYGQKRLEGTTFVNASICDHSLQPTRAPVVLDWPLPRQP